MAHYALASKGQRMRQQSEWTAPGQLAPGRGEHNIFWKQTLREAALVKQGHRCAYCREPLGRHEATADHLTPRSLGGRTTAENIRAVCKPCNGAKGALTESHFLRLLGAPPEWAWIELLLAHARWRIWVRQERAETRILRAAGLEKTGD